jgi:AcrR family transcriptional regulator
MTPSSSSPASREVRREGDRELPLGPKARRTRAAILEAAAELFAERGYQRTTVGDVADAAGVSLGTVYQYFRDRGDIVAALVRYGVSDLLRGADNVWRPDEGRDGLERVLGRFVTAYIEAGAVARVWEEVSHVDTEMGALRRKLGRAFTRSIERSLSRAVTAGLVRDDLDVPLAAVALSGMVDRYCYVVYAFDPPPGEAPSAQASAQLLADLWASAIGLQA